MASIELKDLRHSYQHSGKLKKIKRKLLGETNGFAVENLSIRWEDGSANALLGPSGCGKTTLLNVISGLIRPNSGQVLFNDLDVTDHTPEQRRIAQVFQFPVVYDSMDVYGNLAFPLRNDGMAPDKVRERVHEIADILELTGLLRSSVLRLTPAEKQKIALGRGLVRPDASAVLLDEPLTVIDPKQQWGLRRKLRQVQRQLKITMIYVTHDQHEALTFADSVTVMSGGAISQTGSPEELHSDPASPFVGYFIGSPGMNLLDCSAREGMLHFQGFTLPLPKALAGRLAGQAGPLRLGIRPELVQVSLEQQADAVRFGVLTVENNGAYKVLTLERQPLRIKARVPETAKVAEGQPVWVSFPEKDVKLFANDRRVDR